MSQGHIMFIQEMCCNFRTEGRAKCKFSRNMEDLASVVGNKHTKAECQWSRRL